MLSPALVALEITYPVFCHASAVSFAAKIAYEASTVTVPLALSIAAPASSADSLV